MRIFLTGATGFVGSAITSTLLQDGHHVIGLARSDATLASLVAAGAIPYRGDLTDAHSLQRATESADAVIHAAFDHDFSNFAASCDIDRQAIATIGAALAGSGKRLIVTAGLPPTPGRTATEDELAPDGVQGMPRLSEQTALSFSSDVHVSVIRMSQVHDRHRQGFASYFLAHAQKTGVSAYIGEGNNRWPAVHRQDAARLYRHVLEDGVAGQRYHALTQEGIRQREVAEAIGRRLNVPVVALAAQDAAQHFGWLERIARMDVPASSTLTQARLGWRPAEPSGFIDDIDRAVLAAT